MLRNGYQQIFSLDCFENQSRVTSKEREMLRNEIRADFQIADFGGKFKVNSTKDYKIRKLKNLVEDRGRRWRPGLRIDR